MEVEASEPLQEAYDDDDDDDEEEDSDVEEEMVCYNN